MLTLKIANELMRLMSQGCNWYQACHYKLIGIPLYVCVHKKNFMRISRGTFLLTHNDFVSSGFKYLHFIPHEDKPLYHNPHSFHFVPNGKKQDIVII